MPPISYLSQISRVSFNVSSNSVVDVFLKRHAKIFLEGRIRTIKLAIDDHRKRRVFDQDVDSLEDVACVNRVCSRNMEK